MENNLFDFATKELSQDAMLCWCINWLRFPNAKLYALGKAMMDIMLNVRYRQLKYEILEIKQQFCRIYVLVVFRDSENSKYSLIIEDKIDTSVHDDQITRYKKDLEQKNEYSRNKTLVAYVKTGFLTDDDKALEYDYADDFCIVDLDTMISTILPFVEEAKSEILTSYYDYLYYKWQERKVIRDAVYNMSWDISSANMEKFPKLQMPFFQNVYAQYAFLDMVFSERKLKQVGLKYSHFDSLECNPSVFINCVYNGNNKGGGSPWTQYSFWSKQYEKSIVPNNRNYEYQFLFWRIDAKSKRDASGDYYYLALRHYNDNAHQKCEAADQRKRVVYSAILYIVNKLLCESTLFRDIQAPIGQRSSYKESDLLFIPFDNVGTDPMRRREFCNEINRFSKAVVDEICAYCEKPHTIPGVIEDPKTVASYLR